MSSIYIIINNNIKVNYSTFHKYSIIIILYLCIILFISIKEKKFNVNAFAEYK